MFHQTNVITVIPTKVIRAPIHANKGGQIPVFNHSMGRIITGVVADRVVITPVSPRANPYNKRVIPKPIAKNPLKIIIPIKFEL